MTTEIEHETFNQHRDFLEERIDPDSGLLDKLRSNGTLDYKEFSDIKDQHPAYKRNSSLLQYIINTKKYDCLIGALIETRQTHLVNYLIAKGEYEPEKFGEDWPLTKSEVSILDANHDVLIDLINPDELVGKLYSRGVINRRQRDAISSKFLACYEKNEALLEVLRRRSLKDIKVTIQCLRESKQDHIAELLEKGGVLAKVHAEGLDYRTEEEIIASFQRMLKNKTPEERQSILQEIDLNVISVQKGESVVLYVYCKTVIQIIQLKEMQIKGSLKTAVQRLFMKLLTFEQNVEVTVENPEVPFDPTVKRQQLDLQQFYSPIDEVTVTLSEDEYERCRSYFPAGIKLRAALDFDPKEMHAQQCNELEDILQSKVNAEADSEDSEISSAGSEHATEEHLDKGDVDVELKVNAHEGQQEGNTYCDEAAGKTEMGDYMLDDDQNRETKRLRQVEEQKLKERAPVAELENLMETEKEQEKSDSMHFAVDTLHEPTSNLVEDLQEELLFHSEEKESKPESNELETSLEGKSEGSEISSAESKDAPEEHLNPYKMVALSFKKGDMMETILPEDIGDTITWWRAIHMGRGEIGYVPRRLVVIDYQMHATSAALIQTEYLKSASSDTSMSNLPLELLDSILQKSYLQHVLRKKQFLNNKDYHAINQMASVDCSWFQRIGRRKFKRELWRRLIAFYRRKEKIASVYRINRQYLEENIQLQGLVVLLKSNDCLTDVEIASLYRQNLPLGKKNRFKSFRDLISEVVKKTEAIHSVFSRCICKAKQHSLAEVIENGEAMTKVEIKFQKVKTLVITRQQNLKIVERIKEFRDKMKISRSHQIGELMNELEENDLEILSAGQVGDIIIVWIRCKTMHALEKLQTLDKSKHIVEFFTGVVKNLSFSSGRRNLYSADDFRE